MISMCVAEVGARSKVTAAVGILGDLPMEILSCDDSPSDLEADEDNDTSNQSKPKKSAAITSRKAKRTLQSPELDASSVASIKEKLKSIMQNLGALPLVEKQLEGVSGQITADQKLFVAINEEIIQKKKKHSTIESRISEVHRPPPPAHSHVCGWSCKLRRRLSKRSLQPTA